MLAYYVLNSFDIHRLHSSWQTSYSAVDVENSSGGSSYEQDPKKLQEQWEKFQQSRLYLPESKLQSRIPPSLATIPPSLTTSQEVVNPNQQGLAPLLSNQERWERFQRSPVFHSVNNGDVPAGIHIFLFLLYIYPSTFCLYFADQLTNPTGAQISNFEPGKGRKRAPTLGELPRPNLTRSGNLPPVTTPVNPPSSGSASAANLSNSSTNNVLQTDNTASNPNLYPHPVLHGSHPPAISEDMSVSSTTHGSSSIVHNHGPTSHLVPTPPSPSSQTSPQRVLIQRNPSFKYGAYVHEPTQFRAHADDTPEEYTRLALSKTTSLPNIMAPDTNAIPTLQPRTIDFTNQITPATGGGENAQQAEDANNNVLRRSTAYAHALGSHRMSTQAHTQEYAIPHAHAQTHDHANTHAHAQTQEFPNTPQVNYFGQQEPAHVDSIYATRPTMRHHVVD